MQQKPVFTSGTVKIYIAENETAMGELTADYITAVLKDNTSDSSSELTSPIHRGLTE